MAEGTPRSEENKNCSMIEKQIFPRTPWRSPSQSKHVFPEGTEIYGKELPKGTAAHEKKTMLEQGNGVKRKDQYRETFM